MLAKLIYFLNPIVIKTPRVVLVGYEKIGSRPHENLEYVLPMRYTESVEQFR
jgi:microcompartment protein CcmL/EutN